MTYQAKHYRKFFSLNNFLVGVNRFVVIYGNSPKIGKTHRKKPLNVTEFTKWNIKDKIIQLHERSFWKN